MKKPDWSIFLLRSLVAALALIFVVRLFPPLRFLVLISIGTLVIGMLVYLLLGLLASRKAQRQRLNTVVGRIEERVNHCDAQIARYQREIDHIKESTAQLEARLRATSAGTLPEPLREQSAQLLAGFESEYQLRVSKREFFEDCRHQLEQLLQQHRLHEELTTRRAELARLRETQYDDVAQMETLRYDMEREETYLQTITELGQRVTHTESVDHALHLRAELQQMRAARSE